MEISRDSKPKREKTSHKEMSRDNGRKDAYIGNELQLETDALTFNQKNSSLLSANSILSHSPMAYNNTVSLDNLSCTENVDFGKSQDRFGQCS